jgi:hypothetical protein
MMIQTHEGIDITTRAHKLPETNGWKSQFRLAEFQEEIEEGGRWLAITHHLPETFGSEEEAIAAAFHNARKLIDEHVG